MTRHSFEVPMTLVFLLLLLLTCQAALTCTIGTIRLNSTNSSNSNAGRVEICYQPQTWESINDDQWDDADARVACYQLGFAREGATAYRKASYDPLIPVASGLIHVNGFSCSGWESRLTRCFYNNNTYQYNYWRYDHSNDAGIKCLYHKPCQPRVSVNWPTEATSATFSWNRCSDSGAAYANADRYLVSCANSNVEVRPYQQLVTVDRLSPNKQYTCFMYGIDILGRLGTRARFTLRTAQSTPSFAPCGFRYTSVSSTSVSLAWEPPQADGSSGAIAYYWLIFNCTPHYSLCNREERVHAIRYNAFNLLRNHEYSISIKACTNKGCGCRNSSITVVLPVTVPSFLVGSETSTDVTLSWRRPRPGDVHYYLIRVTNLETLESVTHSISHTRTSTTVSSLHPYHHYKFSIAAVFAVATGPFESRIIRMPEAVPTGGPQVVNCRVVNMTTLSVNWTEPYQLERNGPIEQYIVHIWNNDTMKFVHSSVQNVLTASGMHVASLDTYRNYNCSVAAFARGGAGPFTTANVWLTDHVNSLTSPPMNLELLMNGPRNASIGWLVPYTRNQNTTIEYYGITVQSKENSTVELIAQQTQEAVHTVASLHPNHNYTITVEAVTQKSSGPSASIDVQTLEDVPSEPPQNLQYTKVTTHSITLTWEPPPLSAQNGVIIGYTIQVLKVDDNTSFNDFQVSKEPSLTVTGLDDDTTYNFSVAGNTSIGAGPYSMHISTKTIKNRALDLKVGVSTGVSLLLVLMTGLITLLIVCYRYRLKLKKYTSKSFPNASKTAVDVSVSEKEGQNVHRLTEYVRERASNADGKEQTPELPNRDYLEDIDFVSNEFNLFFKRKQDSAKDQSGSGTTRNEYLLSKGDAKVKIPALPDRRYLEDIDFVSDEFDLFFRRRPGSSARADSSSKDDNKNGTVKVACSRNVAKSTVMEKPVVGPGHYLAQSLKKAQVDSSSSGLYHDIQPQKKPIVYENVGTKKGSNPENHYQPLSLARQESKDQNSGHYQSLNLKGPH